MQHRLKRCFGLPGFLVIALVAVPVHAETEALTSIRQIREVADDGIGRAVDFEATVTFVHPRHHFLFVQDGKDAIFVHERGFRGLAKGDRVRVRGRVRSSGVRPTILPRRVERIGREPQSLNPVEVSIQELGIGDDYDCAYVSLVAEVLYVVVGDSTSLLLCQSGTKTFYVSTSKPELDATQAHEWIGRRVRCVGALGVQLLKRPPHTVASNEAPHVVQSHRLFCSLADDVTPIDEKQPRPIAAPRSFSALLNTKADSESFSTFGQVSLVETRDERNEIVLSDGRHVIRTHVRSTEGLSSGTIVRVCGRREFHNGEMRYEADVIQKLSQAQLNRPSVLTLAEAVARFVAEPDVVLDQRISVEGSPVGVREIDGAVFLELKAERHSVDIKLKNHAYNALAFASPEKARVIRVSGTAVPAERKVSGTGFQIVVSDDNDVELITKRVVPKVLLFGIGGLMSAMLLSLVWVKTLRTEVARQTRHAGHRTAQLGSSYDAIDDGLLALDSSMRTLAVNSEFERITGHRIEVGDLLGALPFQMSRQLLEPEEFSTFWQKCLDEPGAEMAIEVEFERPERSSVIVRTAPILTKEDSKPIGRLIILRDETENRRLQAELLHSNKLEAVGRLVGGVAHDFNNVLMAISANLSIAGLDESVPVREVAEELTVAEDAAFRGAEILRRLLTFSTRTQLELKPQRVNQIIEKLADLVRHSFDARTTFEFDLDPKDPVVMAESTTLEQVLLNLYVNARDAMPDGGTIVTSTRVSSDVATGRKVVLVSVADDGTGIPDDIRGKIFEPYFSTKDSDKGSGLGLSVSYRAIQQHGGTIHVKSRPVKGTEFQVVLPTTNEEVPAETTSHEPLPKRTETILVVEDEDVVRTTCQGMLRRQGYSTIPAANGKEALRFLADQAERIDLILLDLTMPGMSGSEVLTTVKGKWPKIPVILCSGYLAGQRGRESSAASAELAKPYSWRQLIETVHSVLSSSDAIDFTG